MIYMLDTNVCVALIRHKPPAILSKIQALSIGDVGLSSITVAELAYGAQKSRYVAENQQALEQFLLPLQVADFDYDAALAYGEIRARLERQGAPIGSLDTLIGAHAVSLGVTLVTYNLREFSRIPDLSVEDWTQD